MTKSEARQKYVELERHCQAIEIVRRMAITAENLPALRGVVPSEQQAEMTSGDIITVVLFYNGLKKYNGTMTVWHNRLRAAIKAPGISHAGEWDEARGILVTDEAEQGWSIHGEEISGSIAFDLLGFEGILCSGRFFRASPPPLSGLHGPLLDGRV